MLGFSRTELGWAEAALGAIFPGSEGAGLVPMARLDIGPFFASLQRAFPLRACLGIRAAIWMIALAPLFVLGRFRTIRGLGPAEREKVIVSLMASRQYFVRQLVMLLKGIGALVYAAVPTVRARMLGTRPASPLVPLRSRRHAAA